MFQLSLFFHLGDLFPRRHSNVIALITTTERKFFIQFLHTGITIARFIWLLLFFQGGIIALLLRFCLERENACHSYRGIVWRAWWYFIHFIAWVYCLNNLTKCYCKYKLPGFSITWLSMTFAALGRGGETLAFFFVLIMCCCCTCRRIYLL